MTHCHRLVRKSPSSSLNTQHPPSHQRIDAMQGFFLALAIVWINLIGWFGSGALCWGVNTYRWSQPELLLKVSTHGSSIRTDRRRSRRSVLCSTTTNDDEETALQWALFQKYQARGSWRGIWTTYDYLGDVIDETVASVNLQPMFDFDNNSDLASRVDHTHTIVMGAKKSDCATCFDSFECKTIPVASYSPGQLGKGRCASASMVIGPSILRSGAMATELILSYGDGRIRVMLYHAPVWQAKPGADESADQVGPPDGLKLYRVMISREALRSTAPTPETEALLPADDTDASNPQPRFYRPVPPYAWHKKWGGTSWTWGPSTGNRGWRIEEMEEADAWHGRPTGDAPNVWSLRLNAGGILVQTPRVIVSGEAGLCRVAWLPNEETLLRVEASVLALEPILTDDDELDVIGFHPPSLASLRCDLMQKMGDLDDLPRFEDDGETGSEKAATMTTDDGVSANRSSPQPGSNANNTQAKGPNDGNLQDLLGSLKL